MGKKEGSTGKEGDNDRVKAPKQTADESAIPKDLVVVGDGKHEQKGGKDHAEGSQDRPGYPRDPVADKGCSIDHQRARGKLGEGKEVGELGRRQPVVVLDDLGSDQGNNGIPPSEAEKTDF